MEIDWRIIKKWALGSASLEELKELETWKKDDEGKQIFLRQVSSYYANESWIENPSAEDVERVWKRLNPKKVERSVWLKKVSAVAAVLLLGVAAWSVRSLWPALEVNENQREADPVFLVFSDGTKYELNQKREVDTLIRGLKIDVSGVHQVVQDSIQEEVLKYHELVVPRGAEYRMTLADGTVVYLNAESSLRFPEKFGKERKVFLSGEAYFEVRKDSLRPFYVEFGQSRVKVLGTHFNVKAYPEVSSYTTLVNGSVAVEMDDQIVVLKPGEQCEISSETGEMQLHRPDLMSVLAWKNGEFVFRDVALKVLMEELSRWYDINIEYEEDGLKDMRFSLYIDRSETLTEVLEKMVLTDWIHYRVDEKKIIIKKAIKNMNN